MAYTNAIAGVNLLPSWTFWISYSTITVKSLIHGNIDWLKKIKSSSQIHYSNNLNHDYCIEFARMFYHNFIWDKYLYNPLHWEKYRFVMTILDPTENDFHIDNKRILLITIKQIITSERSEWILCLQSYNLFAHS